MPEPQAAEILVVLVDARLVLLGDAGDQADDLGLWPTIWGAVLVLLRAHALLGPDQQAVLCGAGAHRSAVLAGAAEGLEAEVRTIDWEAARQAVANFALEKGALTGVPLMAAALSQALCHIRRRRQHAAGLRSRILVLEASALEADMSSQEAAFAGCAFSAKADGTPVDVLSLGQRPSSMLRQVSFLAEGIHHAIPAGGLPAPGTAEAQKLPLPQVLVPTLLTHFLPGVAVRKELAQVTDFGNLPVHCRCCNKPQDIAFVCSCCLAVYCRDDVAICKVCKTRLQHDRDPDCRIGDAGLMLGEDLAS